MNRPMKSILALGLALCVTAGAALAAPTVYGYQEGLAKATENGRWGYADPAGNVVIPLRYESVLDFDLGTAMVREGGKMGVIRQDGAYLLQPEYDTLEDIGYGLYIAQRGDGWGVVTLLPFPSKLGGDTHEFYPLTYDSVRLGQADGLDALVLTSGGGDTVVPLSSLTQSMIDRGVPAAHFPLVKGRTASFSDVGTRDWFTVWVDVAYNVSLMEGVGGGRFAPNQTLTVAEALKMAAFLESQATGDDFHTQPITGSPWYRSSVTYCTASGIITDGEFDNYERAVTRAEMARILGATTLGHRMPEVNSLARVKSSLPDVKAGDYAAEAIWSLYAKGVFTGTDGKLTFNPASPLTRAEAAAIVSRMARAEQRILLWPEGSAYRSAGPVTTPAETAPGQ